MSSSSVIDREVLQVIPQKFLKEYTKESRQVELLHKIHGTSILYSASKLLCLSPSAYATSASIFHRFYQRQNCTLDKYDVWSVALGSILLASKVEEDVRRISDIILVFIQVYRRMRLEYGKQGESNKSEYIVTAKSDILQNKKLSEEEKENLLRYTHPLPRYGILYKEWEEQIMEMENIILRELGFMLYWIPDSHPHTFILYFIKVLEIEGKDVAQRSWNYCNDSYRLDFCVRFSPEIIACAAIHLGCIDCNVSLPLSPMPWWHAFLGSKEDENLSTVCNGLMALKNNDCIKGYSDALTTYVVSRVEGGSFVDPGSYSWNAMD